MPVYMEPKQILRPVSGFWITFTFVLAFTLNFIPWDNRVVTFQPDFIAMLLIYWCIHQPGRIGVGIGFLTGIVMDIADANVFGQHALAYVVVAFVAWQWRRRILMHTLLQQSAHALVLLLLVQITMVITRMLGGGPFIGLGYFVSSITGALLWSTLSHMLQAPQRQSVKAKYEATNAS